MDGTMVLRTQPDHIERVVIPVVVVSLDLQQAANDARSALYLPAFHVDVEIGARIHVPSLFIADAMRKTPRAHIGVVARAALLGADGFSGLATRYAFHGNGRYHKRSNVSYETRPIVIPSRGLRGGRQ